MRRRAFTLVELLVVIAIIGLLSTVAVVALDGARVKARDTRRVSDLKQMQKALELYYDANGEYPPSQSCGQDCNGYSYSCDSSWDHLQSYLLPYMAKLPKDPLQSGCNPWDGQYGYAYGNVTRDTAQAGYDLIGALEDTSHSLRCGAMQYRWRLPVYLGMAWCGGWSTQLFVVNP